MTEKQIAMGKISYINASPVFYGLDHGLLPHWLKMISDVPSVLNRKIKTGEIKLSPVSTAFYAMNHQELLLLPDLSISCHGSVLSVLLASNYAIDDLDGKKVRFSRESASAASFLKMIFRQRKISPIYETGPVDNFPAIAGSVDAVLVIGDTALVHSWGQVFRHCIDLGRLWYDMTQLPFVFAVWVVRRSFVGKYPFLVKEMHELLLKSKAQGYQHIDKVVEAGQKKLNLERPVIQEYFDRLYCNLDDHKIKAMEVFFDSLLDQGILNEKAKIRFFKSG